MKKAIIEFDSLYDKLINKMRALLDDTKWIRKYDDIDNYPFVILSNGSLVLRALCSKSYTTIESISVEYDKSHIFTIKYQKGTESDKYLSLRDIFIDISDNMDYLMDKKSEERRNKELQKFIDYLDN